jgi:hypothetical protein
MKKYSLLLIFTALITIHLCAQTSANLLKDNSYCSISPNGPVMILHATNDSLIINYKKEMAVTGQDRFQITRQESRGEYTLVYVKMDPASMMLIGPSGSAHLRQPLFGVFVFRFEKDDNKLLVLHDGRLWLTEKEAKNTYAQLRLPYEYFNTWYLEARFERFTRYPDFRNADEPTVQKVALFWIKKIQEHREKKLNTQNTDRNGADYGRDNLTKVLVNNHLSPLATPSDFDAKLKQYHLNLIPTNQLPQKPTTIL